MARERQSSYNWLVAVDLFLGGTGAGVFLAGFALERLDMMVSLAKVSEVLAPILVVVGSVFLLLHAGSGFKTKIYLLFLRPRTSWMSRGAWILAILVVTAFLYVLTGGNALFGWVAVVFALLAAVYPGFLLAENKPIPFWRSPVLPPLFLFSGLSTGVACLLVLAPFLSGAHDATVAMTLRALSLSGVFLIVSQLIMLWGYLGTSSTQGSSFSESVHLAKGPLFFVGVLGIGLILPSVLLIVAVINGKSVGLGVIAGILLLIGGMLLRLFILRSGVYLPRHSL